MLEILNPNKGVMMSDFSVACINCRALQTGWFHPRCGNPESPQYQQGVKDSDSCEVFSSKYASAAASVPVTPAKSTKSKSKKIQKEQETDDGLYDPDVSA